jgi:hypothetical protein
MGNKGSSLAVKRLSHKADHSPPPKAVVQITADIPLNPHTPSRHAHGQLYLSNGYRENVSLYELGIRNFLTQGLEKWSSGLGRGKHNILNIF